MIGSQEAYQMMMDAYDDPSVIQRYGTFDALLNAIVTNCPVTYLDYNFNPVAFNPYKDSSGLLTIIGPYNNAREYELSPNYMEKYVAYYEEFVTIHTPRLINKRKWFIDLNHFLY